MTFALAPALWGLGLLPVLVLLRILDRRPREVVVPSLIPWRAAASAEAPAGSRRALLDWPLLLQMAAVSLAVLGAAGPMVGARSAGARPIVVVLDNSASMGARSAGGGSRLSQAKARALAPEGRRLAGDLVAVVATAPEPRVFAGRGADGRGPLAALDRIGPAPSAGDLPGAVAAARAAGGPGALIVVAADDLAPIEDLPAGDLIAIRVGEPVRNLGIVAATAEDGRVFAAVRNASAAAGKARLALSWSPSGKEADSREAVIAAGGRAAFDFRLPAGPSGQVELRLPPDDLDADNVVRLSLEPPPQPEFLGRPGPSLARALAALGFPEGSGPGAAGSQGAKLLVACGRWPAAVPPGSFALIVAPPEGRLAGLSAGAEAGPAEARLAEGEPEFFPGAGGYSFRIPEARTLAAGPGSRVLLADAGRPLAVLSADGSACVLAFDPEATDWVKHASFPVFLARLAERAPRFGALRRSAGAEGLLSEEETACRTAGRERREEFAVQGTSGSGGRSLAPWLFSLALALLAGEWWLTGQLRLK